MKKIINISTVLLLVLLSSCVNEEDIFNEDFIENDQNLIQSSLITSFLNEEFILNSVDTENCIELIFPIELGYNTNQLISVNNFKTLEEIAQSQSSAFHLDNINFPFTVNSNNQELSINSLNEYLELMNSCGVISLKNTLLETNSDCFEIEYPVGLFNNNGEQLIFENEIAFTSFLDNTTDVIPEFIYPILVNDTRTVNNNFELYEILNDCTLNKCFDVNVASNEINPNLYIFDIEVNPRNQNTISWFVNNELLIGETATSLEQQFQNVGDFEVCATVVTDNENCPEERTSCNIITIDCPTFVLTSETDDGKQYLFTIDTSNPAINNINESIDEDNLVWTVQKQNSTDDLIIFNQEGSTEVNYEFSESDTYEVCAISTGTTECEVEVCIIIDIIIEP